MNRSSLQDKGGGERLALTRLWKGTEAMSSTELSIVMIQLLGGSSIWIEIPNHFFTSLVQLVHSINKQKTTGAIGRALFIVLLEV